MLSNPLNNSRLPSRARKRGGEGEGWGAGPRQPLALDTCCPSPASHRPPAASFSDIIPPYIRGPLSLTHSNKHTLMVLVTWARNGNSTISAKLKRQHKRALDSVRRGLRGCTKTHGRRLLKWSLKDACDTRRRFTPSGATVKVQHSLSSGEQEVVKVFLTHEANVRRIII